MGFNKLKKKYIEEKISKKLGNGIYSVNDKYYYCKFKETDKYNEDRYIFQTFQLEKFLKDLDKEKEVNLEKYIDTFKLEVIEDSTYNIKKIIFKK